MPKIKPFNDLEKEWVLLDKKNKVIFASDKPIEVMRKGKEYPFGEVSIEKKAEHELCFF